MLVRPYIQVMQTYFTDEFGVSPKILDRYGAYNIALIADCGFQRS